MKVLMEVKVKRNPDRRSNNNNHLEDDEEFDDDQMPGNSRNNYFEVMCGFCFYFNEDPSSGKKVAAQSMNDSFRSPTDLHELYIDKLQFFIESL